MTNLFANFGISIAIVIVTIATAILVNWLFKRLIRRSSLEMHNDPTNYLFLRHALIGIIHIVGFSAAIYAIPNLRALANSLLAGAGILAIAVGFASKHVLSNIISGFFIVVFKPFRVNDRLTIREMTGVVEDITLRHTVIRDFENRRILIPNELISDEIIINSDFAEEEICIRIDFRISFDSDLERAKEILSTNIKKHPLHRDIRTEVRKAENVPEVIVRLIAIDEYSLKLRAWVWTKNASDGFILKCDVLESVKRDFDKEGITIPYPQSDVSIKPKSDTDTPPQFV